MTLYPDGCHGIAESAISLSWSVLGGVDTVLYHLTPAAGQRGRGRTTGLSQDKLDFCLFFILSSYIDSQQSHEYANKVQLEGLVCAIHYIP